MKNTNHFFPTDFISQAKIQSDEIATIAYFNCILVICLVCAPNIHRAAPQFIHYNYLFFVRSKIMKRKEERERGRE